MITNQFLTPEGGKITLGSIQLHRYPNGGWIVLSGCVGAYNGEPIGAYSDAKAMLKALTEHIEKADKEVAGG